MRNNFSFQHALDQNYASFLIGKQTSENYWHLFPPLESILSNSDVSLTMGISRSEPSPPPLNIIKL